MDVTCMVVTGDIILSPVLTEAAVCFLDRAWFD